MPDDIAVVEVKLAVEMSLLADPTCGPDWEPLFRIALDIAQSADGPFWSLTHPIVKVRAEDLAAIRSL